MNYRDAVDTYINGNISDFKKWLKKASKKNILDAIEYYSGNYGQRNDLINAIRRYLED